MKIKTSELTGAALDWAVAKCEAGVQYGFPGWDNEEGAWRPSGDWSQGGPIIEREKISTAYWPDINCATQEITEVWMAQNWAGPHSTQSGPTPLIAAMRCYVAFKLGDEVDVPEELL